MQEPGRGRKRERERKADDDVTWEKSKIQKWRARAREEEREIQRCVTCSLDAADLTKWPRSISSQPAGRTLLCYMVPATHLNNGSQSALLGNELSSKHTAALHWQRPVLFTHSHPCPSHTQNQTTWFKVNVCVIFGFIKTSLSGIYGTVFLIQPTMRLWLACQTQKGRQG